MYQVHDTVELFAKPLQEAQNEPLHAMAGPHWGPQTLWTLSSPSPARCCCWRPTSARGTSPPWTAACLTPAAAPGAGAAPWPPTARCAHDPARPQHQKDRLCSSDAVSQCLSPSSSCTPVVASGVYCFLSHEDRGQGEGPCCCIATAGRGGSRGKAERAARLPAGADAGHLLGAAQCSGWRGGWRCRAARCTVWESFHGDQLPGVHALPVAGELRLHLKPCPAAL